MGIGGLRDPLCGVQPFSDRVGWTASGVVRLADSFQGASAISLDAKGRLAVPTRYRERILELGGGHLIVTAHPHRSLLMYPAPVWEPIAKKIMALSGFDPAAATLQQLLVGHADEVEMDSAGRVLISPTLRRLAGIDREVMMFGQVSHFRIWNPDSWEKQLETFTQQLPGTMPSGTESLSLF